MAGHGILEEPRLAQDGPEPARRRLHGLAGRRTRQPHPHDEIVIGTPQDHHLALVRGKGGVEPFPQDLLLGEVKRMIDARAEGVRGVALIHLHRYVAVRSL